MYLFWEERILLPESLEEKQKLISLEELYSWEYIHNPEHKHTKFISEMILKCEWCIDQVNQTSAIIPNIVDSYKDWIWAPKSGLAINWWELNLSLVLLWKVWIEISKINNQYSYSVVPADEIYIENWTIMRVVDYTYYNKVKDIKEYYTLKREYYSGYTLNFLYEKNNNSDNKWKKINLNKLVDLWLIDSKNLLQEKELTWINWESLIIITNTDNKLNKILSLVYMIEKLMISVDKELLLLTPQKILFKWIKLKDEDIQKDNWFTDNQEASVDIISKANEYIELDWKVIENKLRLISAISAIPLEDFWFDVSWSIGLQAQKARRYKFESLITNLRGVIEAWIRLVLERINTKDTENINLLWWNIWHTDEKSQIENITLAKDAWLMNDIEALMIYWGVSEKQAKEKIKLLNIQNEYIWEPKEIKEQDRWEEQGNK